MSHKSAEVVPLFGDEPEVGGTEEFPVGRPVARRTAEAVAGAAALDLSGRPKLILTLGAGNTGKTTLMRWIAERAADNSKETYFASVDPQTQGLGKYFSNVHEPKSYEPSAVLAWLQRFIEHAIRRKATACVDFAGGDTTLGRLVEAAPDIVAAIQGEGVEPVALYPLGPRLDDLSPLANLEAAGFQPAATAIIPNEGRISDPSLTREQAFARTMADSAYKAVLARGGVRIWMPRLLGAAKQIEERRVTFTQARDALSPEGRTVEPLGMFNRSYVRAWPNRMEAEFSPIASWLL